MKPDRHPIVKPGDIIEITARRCSDKLQPLLQVGSRFVVKAIGKIDNGTTALDLTHPTRKRAALRANAHRFDWRILTPEILAEEEFQKECRESTNRLVSNFTRQEQLKIAVLPLIINHIAWTYAMRAVDKSVEYRVDILKKITRTVRRIRKDYDYSLIRDLDSLHIRNIEQQTDRFIDSCAKDFTIFYFTVNSEFKKTFPTYPYDDLRTYAIMAMIIIRYGEIHARTMDDVIHRRFGCCKPTIQHPAMKALRTCMEAFAGDLGRFDFHQRDVQLCTRILHNNILKINFNLA